MTLQIAKCAACHQAVEAQDFGLFVSITCCGHVATAETLEAAVRKWNAGDVEEVAVSKDYSQLEKRLRDWSETPFEGDPIIDALLSDVPAAADAIRDLSADRNALEARVAELEAERVWIAAKNEEIRQEVAKLRALLERN